VPQVLLLKSQHYIAFFNEM